MENKYYTPTIDEFHVGFEYEIDNEKSIYSETHMNLFNINHKIKLNQIRVKYLDKEDIESLGWKVIESGKSPFTGKELYKFKINKEVGFNTGTNWYLEDGYTPGTIRITIENYGSWATSKDTINLFIKNKSELKKLMKQLNINE